jgi:hypothetical protein
MASPLQADSVKKPSFSLEATNPRLVQVFYLVQVLWAYLLKVQSMVMAESRSLEPKEMSTLQVEAFRWWWAPILQVLTT